MSSPLEAEEAAAAGVWAAAAAAGGGRHLRLDEQCSEAEGAAAAKVAGVWAEVTAVRS